jgi:hypothetical protein
MIEGSMGEATTARAFPPQGPMLTQLEFDWGSDGPDI